MKKAVRYNKLSATHHPYLSHISHVYSWLEDVMQCMWKTDLYLSLPIYTHTHWREAMHMLYCDMEIVYSTYIITYHHIFNVHNSKQ